MIATEVAQIGIDKALELFPDLVDEIIIPSDFIEVGTITGIHRLVVIIKQEEYSVVEVLFKLADTIFGPLFGETGILFGLTIMSKNEFETSRH